jgi:hypothetical protein
MRQFVEQREALPRQPDDDADDECGDEQPTGTHNTCSRRRLLAMSACGSIAMAIRIHEQGRVAGLVRGQHPARSWQ